MRKISKFLIGIMVIHIMLTGLAPSSALAYNPTNQDQLSLSINKVEPARKELILQKEGSQNIARTSLNFEVMRNGMLTENPRKPLDVVFVFDRSGSMKEKIDSSTTRLDRAIQSMKTAAAVFETANIKRDQKDRYGLVLFNDEVESKFVNGSELTTDFSKLLTSINNIQAVDGTNYNDALLKAEEILKKNKDASRDQLIIFLTDGEPTILNTYDMPEGKYAEAEVERYRCGFFNLFWCTRVNYGKDYPYENLKNHKEDTITNFSVYTDNSSGISKQTFKFNNKTLGFKDHAKVYIENHTEKTAAKIKQGQISIYPVGFGEANKSYLDKLASVNPSGLPMTKVATGDNLNQIFEELIKDIDTPKLEKVQLEVKLPSGVNAVNAEGVRVESGKAIVTPPLGSVKYEVGQAPGLVQFPHLPVSFTNEGVYDFEVKLKYHDIFGEEKTVLYPKKVTVTVQKHIAPTFELKMGYETNALVSNNIIKLQKSNIIEETHDKMNLIYTLNPMASLPIGNNGSLKEIVLKQVVPAGLKASLNGNMTEVVLEDGSSIVSIPIQKIYYESKSTGMVFSNNEVKLSLEIKGEYGLRGQPIPSPTVEFKDSGMQNENRSATVTTRFSELVDFTVKLTDIDMKAHEEYRGNNIGTIGKYIKSSDQLIAITSLKGQDNNQIQIPIKAMEFGESKNSIIITYKDDITSTLWLKPSISVKLKDSNEILPKEPNGNYELKQQAFVVFDSIVPGEGSVYEVQSKRPGQSRYSDWTTINPVQYQYEVNETGVTKLNVKASGGFVRGAYEEEFTINYSEFDLSYEKEMYVGTSQLIKVLGFLTGLVMEWSSSDASVASVDKNTGEVTAKKAGDVTITSRIKGLTLKREAKINVIDFPSYSLVFQKPFYKIKVDQPLNLFGHVHYTPNHLNGKKKVEVIWESSDPSIFMIDQDGKGKGVANGIVVVTVTSMENPEIKASTIVKVGDGGNDTNNFRW